ncbi:MAG TPA: hypothetical protein VFT90_14060, partial [Chryseosolibacter sp.]|nr:hypothetical protein [Chryseosolibacter sp.]
HQLTPYDNLDTLNFTQISRNASLSGMYALGDSETIRKSIQFNLSWQDASDQQGSNEKYAGTSFYNLNAGYTFTRIPQNLSVAVTWNTTLNEAPFMRTRMFGPNASVSKSFFARKLRATFSSSYNHSYSNGVRTSTILNGRLNSVVNVYGKHNISITAVVVQRTLVEKERGITEFTATVGYNYSFAMRQKRK